MGEIRSTLDIVMEKTRGLTMSDQEKRSVKKTEIKGKVQGLLQKFLDHFLSIERLKREIDALSEGQRNMTKEVLTQECADRIMPETDNTPMFEVLVHVAGLDPAHLKKSLQRLHQDLEQKKESQKNILKKQLQAQGISGQAVIPNLTADPEWINCVSEANEEFREEKNSFVQQVIADT